MTTMLTTLVPTTVVRMAMATMCFAARHATLRDENFTSAWLESLLRAGPGLVALWILKVGDVELCPCQEIMEYVVALFH